MNVPETWSLCSPVRARPRAESIRRQRCSAERIAAPPPGRDNSVSPSRHNLLTTLFQQSEPAPPGIGNID